jgi:hypothetical protein
MLGRLKVFIFAASAICIGALLGIYSGSESFPSLPEF